MPDIRRFTYYPSDAVLTNIEAVNIIDLAPPASIQGVGTDVVAVVGEFLKGTLVEPTEVMSTADLEERFGLWSPFSNPGGEIPGEARPNDCDGNGFLAIRNKKFSRLVIVNVDQHVARCSFTWQAGIQGGLRVPAGLRVTVGSDVFATIEDMVFEQVTDQRIVDVRRVAGTSLAGGAGTVDSDDRDTLRQLTGDTTLSLTAGDVTEVEAINEGEMETRYASAIDALLNDSSAASGVSVVIAARHTATIMGKLKTHAKDASEKGKGRIAVVSPPIGTTLETAMGATGVGVKAVGIGLSDRVVYCYPGIRTFIPEFVGESGELPAEAGYTDWPSDASLASVLSQLPPEANPGMANDFLGHVLGLESGVTGLTINHYISFREKGICAPRVDATWGAYFQSGVTSVDGGTYPNLRNIARRRMADFIQDSIAVRLKAFLKTLNTPSNRRAVRGEIEAFLDGLLSPGNPAAQRIAAYKVDEVSGNTPAKLASGIFVILLKVQTLSTMDFIVLQSTIGESVTVEERN